MCFAMCYNSTENNEITWSQLFLLPRDIPLLMPRQFVVCVSSSTFIAAIKSSFVFQLDD